MFCIAGRLVWQAFDKETDSEQRGRIAELTKSLLLDHMVPQTTTADRPPLCMPASLASNPPNTSQTPQRAKQHKKHILSEDIVKRQQAPGASVEASLHCSAERLDPYGRTAGFLVG